MTDYKPNFSENQRSAVCNGELCPQCLTTNDIKCVDSNPDGFAMNYAYDCLKCGAQWEGY